MTTDENPSYQQVLDSINDTLESSWRAIRKFDPGDQAAVVGVWHRSGLAAYPYLPTWQALTLDRAGWVFDNVIRPNAQIWVGTQGGLVMAYSGRTMKSLELPTALRLVQDVGAAGFARFLRRAFPLFSKKEAEDNEYFISNLAVLPEYTGIWWRRKGESNDE